MNEHKGKTLAEMQALKLPRLTDWHGFYKEADLAGADVEQMAAHFARFLPSRETCVQCGEKLGVRWTIVHGVAECYRCGYPCRVYHYCDPAPRVVVTLQYHPDELKERETESEHD